MYIYLVIVFIIIFVIINILERVKYYNSENMDNENMDNENMNNENIDNESINNTDNNEILIKYDGICSINNTFGYLKNGICYKTLDDIYMLNDKNSCTKKIYNLNNEINKYKLKEETIINSYNNQIMEIRDEYTSIIDELNNKIFDVSPEEPILSKEEHNNLITTLQDKLENAKK